MNKGILNYFKLVCTEFPPNLTPPTVTPQGVLYLYITLGSDMGIHFFSTTSYSVE